MCPKNLSEVFDGIIKLLDEYSDELDKNEYNLFKKELTEKKDVIESSYSYVEWVYAHENGEDIVEESSFLKMEKKGTVYKIRQ